ncbi:MAG: signal peptidase I [Lewinellaceae bacterium]|nr:signal peptidase I [Saprospiraceae bacterium]MCB9356708.1 signal peptidase I [Lewinellaceae bacterium]
MSVLIFLIVLYILLGVSMMKLFEKAGIPGWKALVPGMAAAEWCKMIGRKPWYALWFLFPIVNIFIYAGMVIDMVRSFGKHGFWHAALAVIYAPIPFFQIGMDPKSTYEGPILEREREFHRLHHEATEKNDKLALKKLDADYAYLRKSQLREWTEAIVFAVFAAAFIRMFLIEAYVIPTPSMEGTLKVGDFLFVSKAHYGIRTPMTVIQFPLMHNRLPFDLGESYLKKPSLPYYRLPAIEKIDHNEPVVFNWPSGDSVILTPERSWDIYQLRRQTGGALPPNADIIARPIDKKDHYIKRCVGLPGDSLQIRDGQLYINGAAVQNPTHMQFSYKVNQPLNPQKLEEWGVSIGSEMDRKAARDGYYFLDGEQVKKIKAIDPNIRAERVPQNRPPGYVFPNDPKVTEGWTIDDFGPIYIPKKDATVVLTPESLPFYKRIITTFEGNTLAVRDGKIYINGEETSTYTFKQDYFWMMGDNRHNSEDSRIWGYVPEDHIVGKPLFIWFSTKNGNIRDGINWNRIFKSASTM